MAHVYSVGAVVDPLMNVLRPLPERAGAQSVYVKYRPVQANALDENLCANLAPSTPIPTPILGKPVERITALENDVR
ncbi:MAG: hypothetical protein ACUVRU_06765 [Anaerolineae bacterium]